MALNLIDSLIANVESIPVASAKPKARVSTDAFWDPLVPCGHTAYSWGVPEAESKTTNVVPKSFGEEVQVSAALAETKAPVADVQSEVDAVDKPKTKAEPNPKKARASKEPKPEQPKAVGKAAKPAAVPTADVPPFYQLHIQVGQIVKVGRHPEADRLYVEMIDIGEAEPRQILSGLVEHIPEEQMLNARVLVISNLKPSKLKNIMSYGMVLCASNDPVTKTKVVFVHPPTDAPLGSRIFLEGASQEDQKQAPSAEVDSKKKDNAWTKVAPDFHTDEEGYACYKNVRLVTSSGCCLQTEMRKGGLS